MQRQRPDFSDLDDAEPEEVRDRPVAKNQANFPKFDMTNPSQFRAVVRRFSNAHQIMTPEEHKAANDFYPHAHDLAQHTAHQLGVSPLAGAGIVAAASPGTEWGTNVRAVKDLGNIKQSGWDAIHQSVANKERSPEVGRLLRGSPLSKVYDVQLAKAHRLMQGEDPEEVMQRQSSPKTHSFMYNIDDPSGQHRKVDVPDVKSNDPADYYSAHRDPSSLHIAQKTPLTIDFHGHDIGINSKYPSDYSGRGLQSADLPSSKIQFTKSGAQRASFAKRTRYEDFQEGLRAAAEVHDENPINFQSQVWHVAKRFSSQGQPRRGQPYF